MLYQHMRVALFALLLFASIGLSAEPLPAPIVNHDRDSTFNQLAATPDGILWVSGSTDTASHTIEHWILRIDPATGARTKYPVPFLVANLLVGPDGNLWFAFETELARMTPAGAVTTFSVPAKVRKLTAGEDGNIWILGDNAFLGRMTTGGVLTQFTAPAATITLITSSDGLIWLDGQDVLYRINPVTGALVDQIPLPGLIFSLTPHPRGGVVAAKNRSATWLGADGAVRQNFEGMVGRIAFSPDGTMWSHFFAVSIWVEERLHAYRIVFPEPMDDDCIETFFADIAFLPNGVAAVLRFQSGGQQVPPGPDPTPCTDPPEQIFFVTTANATGLGDLPLAGIETLALLAGLLAVLGLVKLR
jgi:hypothetical protein